MRLKKPLEFMHLLLNFTKSSYTEEKINKIFESNKPTTILLKRPIPIHIVYFTARKIEGREYFLYDIYLHDQIIRESTAGNIKATFTVPSKRLDPLRKKKKRKSFYSF
jgi:murein L,D-transpeptidase YcbB/YkuD